MKRIVIIISFISALNLLIGCKSKVQDYGHTIDISTSLSSGHDWVTVADTTIVPLETSEKSLIGQIAEICHEKSEWYILTRENTILKFDKSGKFISQIGSNGNGPGEYTRIKTICVYGDKIYVIDGNQSKVCVFDTAGKWIQDIPDTDCLKFALSMRPVGDGRFIVANGICFNKDIPLYGIWDPSDPHNLIPIVRSEYTYQGCNNWAMRPLAPFRGNYLALKPLSSTVYRLNTESTECDSLINIVGCLPADIETSGDYQQAYSAALSLKGNPIMGIHTAGDFAIISLLKAFAMCHIPSGKWWYADTKGMSLQHSPLPFMLNQIGCSIDNRLVCVVDASTYLNVYADKPEFDKISHCDIDSEDNPVLMIYTLKYSEDTAKPL